MTNARVVRSRASAAVTVAAMTVLIACSGSRSEPSATPSTTLSQSSLPTTTTTATPLVPQRVGQPFTLGDVRLTMLSVEDPSVPDHTAPAPGNRLVSIRYEIVSESAATRYVSEMPVAELRDAGGARYGAEHRRLSVVAGSRSVGELHPGDRMETRALFEVPASATGLQVAFRPLTSAEGPGALVTLE